jgi:hypothetical protein
MPKTRAKCAGGWGVLMKSEEKSGVMVLVLKMLVSGGGEDALIDF